jgi:hypothetical protein
VFYTGGALLPLAGLGRKLVTGEQTWRRIARRDPWLAMAAGGRGDGGQLPGLVSAFAVILQSCSMLVSSQSPSPSCPGPMVAAVAAAWRAVCSARHQLPAPRAGGRFRSAGRRGGRLHRRPQDGVK